MKYYFGRGYVQDGKLEESDGRIVIYDGRIMVSYIRSTDHNYLLRSLAAQYRLPKDDVISNALRMYFRYEDDRVIVCGVRKIDDDDFEADIPNLSKLIKSKLR